MQIVKRWVLFFATLWFVAPALAAVDLQLTQGTQKAMPIAIVPFAGQNDAQSPDNLAAVITADLGNSGRFKPMDPAKMQQQPHNNQNIDYVYWKKNNINNLVVGSVTPLSDGRYQVQMQLLDATNNQQPPLLQESFTVKSVDLRRLAHHISDLVYQQLTGDRGIFSTKIAYVVMQRVPGQPAHYSLEVSDVDGYNPRTLLRSDQPIMSPAWSHNGRSIAYVSFEGGLAAIYVQDLATGGRRLVTKYPGINGAPSWSPDDHKLALVLTQTGYPKIYVVDLATNQLTQITDGYAIDTEPDWAPDGRSLLFTSNRGGGPEIYQINLASKQVQRLTYNSNYNARASFTPDGKSIVMLTQDGGYNIAIQDLASGRVTLLTGSGNTQSPSVAPNGKMVVFADQQQGQAVLGMVSTDGNVKLRLPAREGEVREPAWSPFQG